MLSIHQSPPHVIATFSVLIAGCTVETDAMEPDMALVEPLEPDTARRPPLVEPCDVDHDDGFADCVALFEPTDASFNHDRMPDIVLGPPQAGRDGNASLDVASLGCGGQVVLFFAGPGIPDGPGADLLVFENPFVYDDMTFTEPARVAVSQDGRQWATFPCASDRQGGWPPSGCAGVKPVHAHPEADVDATDPEMAGGDAFDLADVGLKQARFVWLVDVTREHYGDDSWCGGEAGGFDLDAAAAVHGGGG